MIIIGTSRKNVERAAMWVINGSKRNKVFKSAGKSRWILLWIKVLRLK